jgi:biopolymer transport protein ExbB
MDYLLIAYNYFRPGGFVMVLLVMASLWMWGLVFERLVSFWEMTRRDVDFNTAAAQLRRASKITCADGICQCALNGFLEERTGNSMLDQSILEDHVMRLRPRIQQFLQTITILAATSPLLGLLGTVTGMVATFDVISIFGTGNAKALSSGISQALITTQSGLLVGIPGFLMSRLLTRRAHAIERRLIETVIALKREI